MSTDRLADSLKFTLSWEGGYSNNKDDPGGETNFGITRAVYDHYRHGRGLAVRSVKLITPDEVHDIYFTLYWQASHCDKMPVPLDLVMFDSFVNCGRDRVAKWLQASLGVVVDGRVGPYTLAAAWSGDHTKLALAVCDQRAVHYARLVKANKKFSTFIKGWTRRLDALRVLCVASGAPAVVSVPVTG